MEVGDYPLRAVVDTAAEVSIISDQVYDKLNPQPPKLRDVLLHAAGRDMRMKGMIAGPVALKLGSRNFSADVYVAPIEDEMLLGLDFLRQQGVTIHIQHSRLQIGDEHIPMKYSAPSPSSRVARVYVVKCTVVPPNKVKRITGVLDQRLGDFIFQPYKGLPVMIPHAIHPGLGVEMYAINPTDRGIKITISEVLGEAQELATAGEVGAPDLPLGKRIRQLRTGGGGGGQMKSLPT